MDAYQKEVAAIAQEFTTSDAGLSSQEANARTAKFGLNEMKRVETVSWVHILFGQLKSFINYVMLVAAVLSFVLGGLGDAFAILSILVLNILFGFFQEFKAERAMQALLQLAAPKARVLRDGKVVEIAAKEVVPGDVLVIEEGTVIPADARLFDVAELRVDESILTGESVPVGKVTKSLRKEVQIADQMNMVFSGTTAVSGRGLAWVVATGMHTEVGKIAREVQTIVQGETPLQKQLRRLGFFITIAIIIIAIVIFILDFVQTGAVINALLIAVALAVAAIPEGLPAVITITLALGTQRMLKKNVLMRRLNAVETLGSTSVICADKTGTMTKNKMEVVELFTNGSLVAVSGMDLFVQGRALSDSSFIEKLLEVGVCCNNATLEGVSDPTEKALLSVARNTNYSVQHKRVKEIPFSSERKWMMTLDIINKKTVAHMKGAPEVILEKCTHMLVKGRVVKLARQDRAAILAVNQQMASKALRVLGCALYDQAKQKTVVFVGLFGMIDPPRESVRDAVAQCHAAGIRVVMVTGDHALTAKAIASQIGVVGESVTGDELEKMREADLIASVDKIGIYARVSPSQKLKILKALQSRGDVVAMTGDGVNDALALKKADIGIAPGSGSDVAKGASDMVLLDDHFASIVAAVKEGRGIYENLKRFVSYLFSSNLSEVLIILVALLVSLPLPLAAIQILWINLLTDGLPALALGVDPVSRALMGRKPRMKGAHFFQKREIFFVGLQAVVIAAGVLGLFFWYLQKEEVVYAQTIAFSALVVFELLNALNYHMQDRSFLWGELFSNGWLFVALAVSFVLQVVVVYFFNGFFDTVALSFGDWGIIFLVASSIIVVQGIMQRIVPRPI